MACRQLKYPCRLEKRNIHSRCICRLKVREGQVSLSTLLSTARACVINSFFGYFDGLEKSTFQELKEDLHHRFFSFPQNQIFRYVCVCQIAAQLKIFLILFA